MRACKQPISWQKDTISPQPLDRETLHAEYECLQKEIVNAIPEDLVEGLDSEEDILAESVKLTA